MDRLEDVLDPIWIFPTLSRDISLRKQLEKSQGSVDSTLDKLEKAVDEAVDVATLLNQKLKDFDQFLRDQSNQLEMNQTHVQWFLTLVGFSKVLQESQEQMMFLTFNVHEAQDHFMDVGTSCANIREASAELKVRRLHFDFDLTYKCIIRSIFWISRHGTCQLGMRIVLRSPFERLFGCTSRSLGRHQARTTSRCYIMTRLCTVFTSFYLSTVLLLYELCVRSAILWCQRDVLNTNNKYNIHLTFAKGQSPSTETDLEQGNNQKVQ